MFLEPGIRDGLTSPLLLAFSFALLIAAWALAADWHGAATRLQRRMERTDGAPSNWLGPLSFFPPTRRGIRALAAFLLACALLCFAGALTAG